MLREWRAVCELQHTLSLNSQNLKKRVTCSHDKATSAFLSCALSFFSDQASLSTQLSAVLVVSVLDALFAAPRLNELPPEADHQKFHQKFLGKKPALK
jgi:hypothetical protein